MTVLEPVTIDLGILLAIFAGCAIALELLFGPRGKDE